MDKITRKELKTDKFAEEVTHSVEYVRTHRKQALIYAGIGAVVLAVLLGGYYYVRSQRDQRQAEFSAALRLVNAPVGQMESTPGAPGFASQDEKKKAVKEALSKLASQHPGKEAGVAATQLLASMAADEGDVAQARKLYEQVVKEGDANYASLAKLVLADIYASEGKTKEAEALLRGLVDKPTDFVSKQQATIELARLIGKSDPVAARKMLEPLRSERSVISRAAIAALSDLQ